MTRTKEEYAQSLKDPRWQRRRLEIFQRDNWACIYCGNKEEELQIHHVIYLPNKDPWEYEDDHLVTACRSCHASESLLWDEDKSLIAMLSMTGISRRNLYSLATELRRFVRHSAKEKHLQFQRLMSFLYDG